MAKAFCILMSRAFKNLSLESTGKPGIIKLDLAIKMHFLEAGDCLHYSSPAQINVKKRFFILTNLNYGRRQENGRGREQSPVLLDREEAISLMLITFRLPALSPSYSALSVISREWHFKRGRGLTVWP